MNDVWSIINSPVITLIISAYLVSFYLPTLIANSQIQYQQQQKEREDRYTYSQSLLNLYSKRLYLAKNYYWNYLEEKDFQNKKEKLWEDYAESVTEWNIHLVTNIFAIEKYNGKEARSYFEKEVQDNLRALHLELLKIKNDESVDTQKIDFLVYQVLDNRIYQIIYPLSGI